MAVVAGAVVDVACGAPNPANAPPADGAVAGVAEGVDEAVVPPSVGKRDF